MATSLSISEKVEIVRLYSICDGNAAQTRRMLYRKGLDEGKWKTIGVNRANIPCIQTILDMNKTFNETSCIDKNLLKEGKHKRPTKTLENIQRVREEMCRRPEVSKSCRHVSATLDIPPTCVYRILKELKLKSYMPRLLQSLSEDDFDRRLQFCET